MGRSVPRAVYAPWWRPAAALALALACNVSHAAPWTDAAPPSPFLRLAAWVTREPGSVQADFASVALAEVIRVHALEFERLSDPGQVSRRERAKQWRWANALEAFLEQLQAARDALDAGAEVRILVSPPSPVQLMIGGRVVEVSSPRIGNPGALEADIVALYCEAFACDPRLLETPEAPPPAEPEGGWSFRAGMGSTFETPDGLGFMFADVRGRGRKEAACRQVHDELTRLADALARARRQGRAVDFSVLEVQSPGRGDDHRVIVSRDGPSLRMHLPALARAPGVVEVAREWLRARAQGRPHRQLFPRSDLLLSGLLADS